MPYRLYYTTGNYENNTTIIPVEVLQAIEEYAESYQEWSYIRHPVVHAAVYGYLLAQQLEEKD